MIYNSIVDTIGNTPIIRLNRTGPDHVELYVKVESFNPMASVKDRLAYAIIRDAEDKGDLETRPDRHRGHFGQYRHCPGNGLCGARLSRLSSVMAETFSIERRKIMKALGAKVILTPAAERATGMVTTRRTRWRRNTAGFSPGSSKIPRIRPITAALPARRFCWTLRAAAGLLGVRLRHRRHDDRRRRDDQDGPSEYAHRRHRTGRRSAA